jgi:hypothetical protein
MTSLSIVSNCTSDVNNPIPCNGSATPRIAVAGGDDGAADLSASPRYWTLLLVIIPALTLFGNSLVCISVWREASLRSATNYFIVSLAVADIMVAVLVMPPAVYVEVSNDERT